MQTHEVIVTTKNTVSLTLGIISVILAVLALMIGWIPFLGIIAIPFAIIALILAVIGFAAALFKGGRGLGMPIAGSILSIMAIGLPILMTGGAATTMAVAADEAVQELNQSLIESAAQRVAEAEEAEAKRALELQAEQEIEAQAEIELQDYIVNNLELYEVEAKFMDSLLDGKVPGVTFKIKNSGDRTLDRIKVVAYFLDSTGGVIAEEDFYPVTNSPYSLSDSKPLKAGYIWQIESGKFYSAKSVPTEWAEGRVRVEITEIQFAE